MSAAPDDDVKATLDHIGIAVANLAEALAFYRDALGLDVSPPHEVPSEQVRATFVPVGAPALELLEPTAADSVIGRFIDRRGPGIHHITLRVDDLQATLDQLKGRGVQLIDGSPRPGAHGSRVAFIHPAATHGVLVELKQVAAAEVDASLSKADAPAPVLRLGSLELVPILDGYFALDGGAMFGVVPKPLWQKVAPPDERNRIRMAMRAWLVRGAAGTVLIDAGAGDKLDAKFADIYGFDGVSSIERSLATAGVGLDDVDLVIASHLHFDHAGGFTVREPDGTVRPRFPRARYAVRRGEWEAALSPHERNRASYFFENYLPLRDAGVLDLHDDDGEIAPGVRVRRTGGHTEDHQIVQIESAGETAIFVADLLPTAAHLPLPYIMGYDLYPMETLAFKRAFLAEAVERNHLVLFEHDPTIAAGRIVAGQDGKLAVRAEEWEGGIPHFPGRRLNDR